MKVVFHSLLVYPPSFEHQRVTCLQHHFMRAHFYTFPASCHCHKNHVMVALVIRFLHCLSNKTTRKRDVCCAYLAFLVNIVQLVNVLRSTNKFVTLPQLQYGADISTEYQPVAAEDELLVKNRRDNLLVETHNLYQSSAVDASKTTLAYRCSDYL